VWHFFPLNPSAIQVVTSGKSAGTNNSKNVGNHQIENQSNNIDTTIDNPPFTREQETLFAQRLEEGYDFYI